MTIDYDRITRKQAQHIVKLLDENFREEIMARLAPLHPPQYANHYEVAIMKLDEVREYVFGSSDMVECGLEWGLLQPTVSKKKRRKKKKKKKKKRRRV